MKIFWSWQSDRDPNLHHYFVRDALKRACKLLAAEPEYTEADRPEVDHDTKDVPGTQDIASTILQKICAASVFVADMTPIGITEPAKLRPNAKAEDQLELKHLQNPNVMSELGYAEHAVGLSRIILVANRAHYPGANALPFDWRHRSGPKLFDLPDNATADEIKVELKRFADILRSCIKIILANQLPASVPTPQIMWQTASNSDPSIWPDVTKALEYRNASLSLADKTIQLSKETRIFIRLIPSYWTPPARTDLEKQIANLGLHIRASSGDWGLNGAGALAVWGFVGADNKIATSATQWFRDTGELWGVDTTCFGEDKGRRFFAYAYPWEALDNFICKGILGFSALGGKGPFFVRIGAYNLEGTYWPGHFESHYDKALDQYVMIEDALLSGNAKERYQLLRSFWNAMANAYGREPIDSDENFERYTKLKASSN